MNIASLFKETFKFETDERVRHKGDGGRYGSSDLKLLITGRYIEEIVGDKEERIYQKFYKCRCIMLSGSGQEIYFKEHELLSISEWDLLIAKQEAFREDNKKSLKAEFAKIYKYFGVDKTSKIKLKGSDKLFKATGLSGSSKKGVYELHLEEIVEDNTFNVERRYISSKDLIEEVIEVPYKSTS